MYYVGTNHYVKEHIRIMSQAGFTLLRQERVDGPMYKYRRIKPYIPDHTSPCLKQDNMIPEGLV